MKEFIEKKYKHLLWKDELGEPFLLLKYGEISYIDEKILVLHLWSLPFYRKVGQLGPIFNEMTTDDPLYVFSIDRSTLPQILHWGAGKRRHNLNGAWLKKAEIKLCHKIIPFRPKFEDIGGQKP